MACVSGLTNGVYSYVDCCGLLQAGASIGESICLNETYTGTSFGVYIATGVTCTQNCIQGPLSYSFQVTGVCSAATGTVVFTCFGGVPPYTIDNITPGSISAKTGSSPITFSGLTGGTYVFRLNDTLGIQNNELYINVAITPCFEANIINASGTTCGDSNGYLQVTATTTGSPYNILLYKDNVLYDVQTTPTLPYDFTGLGDGIYYATVYDYGTTTANTENVIIANSVPINFGFWKVNTSNCVITTGKLAITGITGTGPYTYLWSTGEIGQIITGLTQGVYSCTVTDSLGCSNTLSEVIGVSTPIGLGILTTTQPTCFSSDGSLTFTLTGGTVPFYFSGSSGQVGYTLSDTFSLTGLSTGNYTVLVRDANFCQVTLNGFLSPTNGFSVVNTNITNSSCSQQNGELSVIIAGLGGFYTYTLSGQTNGQIYSNVSQNQNQTFTNLSNDTYDLIISATGTNCVYSTTVNITSNQKFTISATTTGSTCSQTDGILYFEVGTGYTLPLDYILSDGQSVLNTSLTSYTFNNLVSGTYILSVVDGDGCEVRETVTISTGGSLLSAISTTQCYNGQNGVAEVLIYDGEPTFIYDWSNNIPSGQTGSTISGLTAGTYSVEVTDSSGCSQTHNFTITCFGNNVTTYSVVELCNNQFLTTVGNKRGLLEMLNEGYIDVTSGYTGCVLNGAEFILDITINGSAFTQTFYTATTLNDVPQDTLWQSTIDGILSGITDISSYSLSLTDNIIHIESNCSGDTDPLANASFNLNLDIEYDITCELP
jgi:hypothetical protein